MGTGFFIKTRMGFGVRTGFNHPALPYSALSMYIHMYIQILTSIAHDCLAEESLVHIQMQFEIYARSKTSVFLKNMRWPSKHSLYIR
jgi:hypothetical protein